MQGKESQQWGLCGSLWKLALEVSVATATQVPTEYQHIRNNVVTMGLIESSLTGLRSECSNKRTATRDLFLVRVVHIGELVVVQCANDSRQLSTSVVATNECSEG